MKIMGWRRGELERTLNGLNDTNVPLVAQYKNDLDPEKITYLPAGYADDEGIYYFIPKLARIFGIGVDDAANVFLISLLVIGIVIATSCFFSIFQRWLTRLIVILGMVILAMEAYQRSEVYLFYYFAVVVVIPLFIVLYRERNLNLFLIFALIFSGIIIGYSNFVRNYAGTGVLLFLSIWICLNKMLSSFEKICCSTILFVSTLLPSWHFMTLEKQQNAFLKKINPSYQEVKVAHPFWHSIYMGLAYLNDKYVKAYGFDVIAFEVAKSIVPNVEYCSKEYEQILKKQIFLIVKADPGFIFKSLLMKILSVGDKVFKFAIFGLVAYFYVNIPFRQIIPFLTAACFYTLPGILVMPKEDYILGTVSVAVIFSVYMTGLVLEKYLTTC